MKRTKLSKMYQRHQKPTINWYKENELIKIDRENQTKKYEIHSHHDRAEHLLSSTLFIHNARIEDSGRYRCLYENIQEQTVISVHGARKLTKKSYLFLFNGLANFLF
jgi:hypothetical protein